MSDEHEPQSMYFEDLLDADQPRAAYDEFRTKISAHVDTAARNLLSLHHLVGTVNALDRRPSLATSTLLLRQAASLLDSISILLERGAAENGVILLRSLMDVMLSLRYILQADTDRRALAYQYEHFIRRRRIEKKYLDPNENAHKELRKELAATNDPFASIFDRIPAEQLAEILNRPMIMSDPEYAEVQAEWQRLAANENDLHWHRLFNGPRKIRDLAKAVSRLSFYVFLYQDWSHAAHGQNVLSNIGPETNGQQSIRPIRHPEGGELLASFAGQFHLLIMEDVIEKYLMIPSLRDDFYRRIKLNEWKPRQVELLKGDIVTAPWK
jgi:hypothetical protein